MVSMPLAFRKVSICIKTNAHVHYISGGQFLRAYAERYNYPPVHNLITFGSQHMGVSDIPPCRRYDLICQVARNAAKSAVYSDWAQENIVTVWHFNSYNIFPETDSHTFTGTILL